MNLLLYIEILEKIYIRSGYFIAFVSNFIDTSPLGWLVPGGILVAIGGFFAHGTKLSLFWIYIASTAGMVSTLIGAYYLGSKTGMTLVKRFGQEKLAHRSQILLKKHGSPILITSLLTNFTRFWVSYVAGVQKYNFKLFVIYTIATSLIWNAVLVGVGYIAGTNRDSLEKNVAGIGIVAWIFLFIAIAVIYWKIDLEFRRETKTKE